MTTHDHPTPETDDDTDTDPTETMTKALTTAVACAVFTFISVISALIIAFTNTTFSMIYLIFPALATISFLASGFLWYLTMKADHQQNDQHD